MDSISEWASSPRFEFGVVCACGQQEEPQENFFLDTQNELAASKVAADAS